MGEIVDHMAIGTGLVTGLTSVSGRVDLDGMIDRASQGAVIMAIEIGGVAVDALGASGNGNCRGDQAAVGCVMTGAATIGSMDLTGINEGRGGGVVAANAVGGERAQGDVLFDLGAVVMGVVAEVTRMAGGAGATLAEVDCGVAMATRANDPGAVFRGMTEHAVVVVDGADHIARMAADTERSGENRGRVAVGMFSEIGRVAGGARAFGDHGNMIFVVWISQGWEGVTEAAGVQVYSHRVIGRVAGPDAGRGVGDQVQGGLAVDKDGGMIRIAMLACPVMAGEAAGRIGAGGDDLLNGNAGGGSRVSGFIVTQGAGVLMEVKDTGPGICRAQLGVAHIAPLALGKIDTDSLFDRMDMAVAVKGAGVAVVAIAAGGLCRAETKAGVRIVALGADIGGIGMDLTAADEG